ncbi:MAG: ABC transporter permease [Candidatus Woesearchaeota archaeon]
MRNTYGFYTLTKREFLRFFVVPNNTIFPQMITTLFFFLIFGVAIGSRIVLDVDIAYLLFILPGLMVQNLINGSYSNPSGSLYASRSFGNITDILLAPISSLQFTLAHIIAGMLRGFFLVGGTILVALVFFAFDASLTLPPVHHWGLVIAYAGLTAFSFACVGVIVGLWSKTWDQLNIFINFVVTPLTFLGGVFYTLSMVPDTMAQLTLLNPIFYMISGMRYGMLGIRDSDPLIGLGILVLVSVALFAVTYTLVVRGWNLKT